MAVVVDCLALGGLIGIVIGIESGICSITRSSWLSVNGRFSVSSSAFMSSVILDVGGCSTLAVAPLVFGFDNKYDFS